MKSFFESRKLTAIFCLSTMMALLSCSGGLKKLSGEDRVFVDPQFWDKAQAMFGEFGGGWWLREKSIAVRYEGGNWYMTESHHYQLIVLDADRMEGYANVTIPLGRHGHLISLKARTIKANGEILPVSEDKVYEKSDVPSFMLFADLRSKVFAMPGLSDRCVLDWSWQVETQSFRLGDVFRFGATLPVRRARYSYWLDGRLERAGFRLHYLDSNVAVRPESKTVVTAYGDVAVHTWLMEYIDAFPKEPWSPPRDAYIPTIYLAGCAPGERPDDWSFLAKWYFRNVPWLKSPVGGIEEITEKITDSMMGTQEILQAIMDFVGNNIRYVAVSIDETGYRPNHPVDVVKNQYGDCKDMACLVVSMLRHKGIEAYPALVLTRSEGVINKALAIARFNHMIVYAKTDRGDIWLDPTVAPCPVGYLPSEDRGLDALVIKGEEVTWKRTPEECPIRSSALVKACVQLDTQGNCSEEVTVDLCGDLAFQFIYSTRGCDPTEMSRRVQTWIKGYASGVRVDSCEVVFTDTGRLRARLRGALSLKEVAIPIDDKLVVKPDLLNGLTFQIASLPRAKGRKFPLWFPVAMEESDTIRIEAPSGWIAKDIPMGVAIESDFGHHRISRKASGRVVEITAESYQKAGQIPGPRIDDFLEFWSRARDTFKSQIVFGRI